MVFALLVLQAAPPAINPWVILGTVLSMLALGGLGFAGWQFKRMVEKMEGLLVESAATRVEVATIKADVVSIRSGFTALESEVEDDVAAIRQEVRSIDLVEFAAIKRLVRGGEGQTGLSREVAILRAWKHFLRNWIFAVQASENEVRETLKLEAYKWPDLQKYLEMELRMIDPTDDPRFP